MFSSFLFSWKTEFKIAPYKKSKPLLHCWTFMSSKRQLPRQLRKITSVHQGNKRIISVKCV